MEHIDDAAMVAIRAKAELADRVRAVLRLISPEDITPMGKRQVERVLDEEAATIREEDVATGGLGGSVPPLDWDF